MSSQPTSIAERYYYPSDLANEKLQAFEALGAAIDLWANARTPKEKKRAGEELLEAWGKVKGEKP